MIKMVFPQREEQKLAKQDSYQGKSSPLLNKRVLRMSSMACIGKAELPDIKVADENTVEMIVNQDVKQPKLVFISHNDTRRRYKRLKQEIREFEVELVKQFSSEDGLGKKQRQLRDSFCNVTKTSLINQMQGTSAKTLTKAHMDFIEKEFDKAVPMRDYDFLDKVLGGLGFLSTLLRTTRLAIFASSEFAEKRRGNVVYKKGELGIVTQ